MTPKMQQPSKDRLFPDAAYSDLTLPLERSRRQIKAIYLTRFSTLALVVVICLVSTLTAALTAKFWPLAFGLTIVAFATLLSYRTRVPLQTTLSNGGKMASWQDSPIGNEGAGYDMLKRVLDIVTALLMLVYVAPVLLLIALAIRLDSRGPVLTSHIRVGRRGRPFAMLKFRTRHIDQPGRVSVPTRRRSDLCKESALIRDPRVTRVGRILRRTCLDELPQLLNVLRGEMSLVGPRPAPLSVVAEYQGWEHLRHTVAPGITGWWQVNRLPNQSTEQASEFDIYYVQNRSFWLDLFILVRTVAVVLSSDGAF